MKLSRRFFLCSTVGALLTCIPAVASKRSKNKIITVTGEIDPQSMGFTLIHEHLLVDFIGAAQYDPKRWKHAAVIERMLPLLEELKASGCNTFIDCTPAYLGRDVVLLKQLSQQSELNIITNTGNYGGSDEKFLPVYVFNETESQLAARWAKEFNEGIDGTTIRPGFIKISVNAGPLSEVSQKLIRAAARCHIRTGLTIASHTGPAEPAFQQLQELKQEGVSANAFIWVHAQAEKNWDEYVRAARTGAWISLDDVNESNTDQYVEMIRYMKQEKCLHRTLLSHDAGWYDPAHPDGENIRGYTVLFKKLIPALEQNGIQEEEVMMLIRENPREAFTVRKRLLRR